MSSKKIGVKYNDNEIMKLSLCNNCESVLITSKNRRGDRTIEFLSSKDRRAIVIKRNLFKMNKEDIRKYITSIEKPDGCLKCGKYKIDIF